MRAEPRFPAAAIVLFTAVVLGLAACNTEPTCEKVAERVIALIEEQNQQMMSKFPEKQRQQIAEAMERGMPKEQLVAECAKSFTKEQIACTVAAKTLADVSKCNQAAAPPTAPIPGEPTGTPDQPAVRADTATTDEPTPTEPTGAPEPPTQGEAADAPAQPE